MVVHISTWGKHRWAVSYWLQSNTSLTLALEIATLIINSTFLLILKSHPVYSVLLVMKHFTARITQTEFKLNFIWFSSTTLFVRFWFSKLEVLKYLHNSCGYLLKTFLFYFNTQYSCLHDFALKTKKKKKKKTNFHLSPTQLYRV